MFRAGFSAQKAKLFFVKNGHFCRSEGLRLLFGHSCSYLNRLFTDSIKSYRFFLVGWHYNRLFFTYEVATLGVGTDGCDDERGVLRPEAEIS